MRIPFISLISAGAIALGGCAYGGLNLGYGDPYSSYGYGSQYGYGGGYGGYGYNGGYAGYGYNGYGSPYGYGSGYGYGSPYYGWNDGYYYPGTGYYVYDSYRRPVQWSDSQRRYWTDRQQRAQRAGVRVVTAPNWGGFTRQPQTQARPIAQPVMARERIDERRMNRAPTRSERPTSRGSRDSATDRPSRPRPY